MSRPFGCVFVAHVLCYCVLLLLCQLFVIVVVVRACVHLCVLVIFDEVA